MRFIQDLLTLYILIIFVSSLLSWFPTTGSSGLATTKLVLARLTEPVLRPLRSIMPGARVGVDFSPFVAILILYVIKANI